MQLSIALRTSSPRPSSPIGNTHSISSWIFGRMRSSLRRSITKVFKSVSIETFLCRYDINRFSIILPSADNIILLILRELLQPQPFFKQFPLSTSIVALGSGAAGSVAYKPGRLPPTYTTFSFNSSKPSATFCSLSTFVIFYALLKISSNFCLATPASRARPNRRESTRTNN